MKPRPTNEMVEVQTEIRVRVLPKSSRNQIVGYEENVLKVKLTSPPVEGKANKALIEYMATRLGIAKGRVEITSGSRSRLKTVRICGLSREEVSSLISDNLA
jgi:uncharacterized protein (TIGR00251 family)